MKEIFEIDSFGKWHWIVISKNGKYLARSYYKYTTKGACVKSFWSIFNNKSLEQLENYYANGNLSF